MLSFFGKASSTGNINSKANTPPSIPPPKKEVDLLSSGNNNNNDQREKVKVPKSDGNVLALSLGSLQDKSLLMTGEGM